MKAIIICEKGSAMCNLYIPWSHIYNPIDDRFSHQAFESKLRSLGYEVNYCEKVSIFSNSKFHTDCGWVNYSIQAQVHNGDFIPNLLNLIDSLTINHTGHGRLAFVNRQLTTYKI